MARRSPARLRRRRRRRLVAAVLAIAAAAAWLGGLLTFIGGIPRAVAAPERETDAIVVLTGGSLRLESGIRLLERGRAKKLFVSGVHRGVDVRELLRISRQAPEELDCCIVLGHRADDTAGNAAESAAWMRRQSYRSLRLVTASYHMPRSLLEFRVAMPEADIVPHPVFPDHVKLDAWWRWPGTAVLIAGEYNKFLVAFAAYALHWTAGGGGIS
ncbi:MAG: YdcF family protein [Alphaproteobacteria bacterium]|nr:YdcF family protein [Alphaproteobacteria bacterium]